MTNPTMSASAPRGALDAPLLEVDDLRTYFDTPRGIVKAVDGVSFDLYPGETLGVVGESGCGKSTLGRLLVALEQPTEGSIVFDGQDVTHAKGAQMRKLRRNIQIVFQDPYTSLNPRRTVGEIVGEPLEIHSDVVPKGGRRARVQELLELVGLAPFAEHRPREVSGGMAQRASLARALARRPGVLLLDEPFGALDALTRLKMQDLLLDVHAATGTTVLLITHDVEEALQLADRVLLLARDVPAPDGVARPGATVGRIVDVPGARPRDRADARLAQLRSELLEGLGVESHAR